MMTVLRTRRWIGFTLLVMGVVIAFGLLSQWQWHRAEERDRQSSALHSQAAGRALDLDGLRVAGLPEWQPVEVTGSYDATQFAVRRRPLDGRNGFWLLSRLTTDTGAVWVNRGWLPAIGDALELPRLPAPPQGEVKVRGYYRNAEISERSQWQGVPVGMVPAIAPSLMADSSVLPGYLQLSASEPPQSDLVLLPLPEIDSSRNISYAVQWVLFAVVAVTGWFIMLRREARAERKEGRR